MAAKAQTSAWLWLAAVLIFFVLPSMRWFTRLLLLVHDRDGALSVSSHPRAAAMNLSEVAPLDLLLKTCGMANGTKAFVTEVSARD